MFVYTAGEYTTKPEEYKYKKTSRGLDATCKIYDKDGKLVATLHDKACDIVAKVEFKTPESQAVFEAAAVAALPNVPQRATVSVFARQITMRAEKAWVDSVHASER